MGGFFRHSEPVKLAWESVCTVKENGLPRPLRSLAMTGRFMTGDHFVCQSLKV